MEAANTEEYRRGSRADFQRIVDVASTFHFAHHRAIKDSIIRCSIMIVPSIATPSRRRLSERGASTIVLCTVCLYR